MMKLNVIKVIYFQLTEIEDKKNHDDPDVPVIKKKDHYFVKWLEEFFLYSMSVVGVRVVIFAYAFHTN